MKKNIYIAVSNKNYFFSIKIVVLFYAIFFNAIIITAQNNIHFKKQKNVVIKATKLKNYSAGTSFTILDSATILKYKSENTATILQNETGVNIKSYGVNGLATPTFRGSSAGQVAVVWNGINLLNANNGVVDFTLLPAFVYDDITIQNGGTSAMWGSGAVSASIHLQSNLQQKTNIEFGVTGGSFGNYTQNVKMQYSAKNKHTLRLYNHDATNNFPFYNTTKFGSPKEKLQHAKFAQKGAVYENSIAINTNNSITSAVWLQATDRQIAPSITQAQSTATQQDTSTKLVSTWLHNFSNSIMKTRLAYTYDKLHYTDIASNINTNTGLQNCIIETEYDKEINKNNSVNIGGNFTNVFVKSKELVENITQNKIALLVNYKMQMHKFSSSLNVRQEYVQNKFIPISANFGLAILPNSASKWQIQCSRNYKLPTINDMYWMGLGNAHLLPEDAIAQELSWQYNAPKKIKTTATIYNRTTKNWIQWLPDNNNIWHPQNLLQVWCRGLELSANYFFIVGKINGIAKLNYAYNKSTNQKNAINNDNIGKQLMYTPLHKQMASVQFTYNNYTLELIQNYVSKQFYTSDNMEAINGYISADMYVAKSINFRKNNNFYLFCRIINIFNKNYQSVAFNPMPLLHYNLGITYKITPNSKIN